MGDDAIHHSTVKAAEGLSFFFWPGAPGVEVFQRGKVKVQVFRNHSLTTNGQPGGEKKVVSSSESKGFCDFSIYDWGVTIYETTGDELGIHCL